MLKLLKPDLNRIPQLSRHQLSSSFLTLSDLVLKVSSLKDPLLHSMDYKQFSISTVLTEGQCAF